MTVGIDEVIDGQRYSDALADGISDAFAVYDHLGAARSAKAPGATIIPWRQK